MSFTLIRSVHRRAIKVANVISQNRKDRTAYRWEMHRRRDIADRERSLLERGREEGRKERFEQGRLIGQLSVFQLVLGELPTPQDALEALSMEELRQRVEALRVRIASRPE